MNQLITVFVAVFLIVNPLSAVPMFLAMTASDSSAARKRSAVLAALTCTVTLAAAAMFGEALFRFFGVTIEAFQIAGGVLLFLYSIDMVQARTSRMTTTAAEVRVGVERPQVGITPLGIPMLAGPGAIATVMSLRFAEQPWLDRTLVMGVAVLSVGLLVLAILWCATALERWLSAVSLGILSRISGLMLAAVAAEMVLQGVHRAFPPAH